MIAKHRLSQAPVNLGCLLTLYLGLFSCGFTKPQEAKPTSTPTSPEDNTSTTCPASNWKLAWQDNFTTWNPNNWNYDLGNYIPNTNVAGWGNGELEYYTRNNAFVQNGLLTIRAKKEHRDDRTGHFFYTSARLKSTYSQTYGCIEVRARLPAGKGIWPAIWMLPQTNHYGGWAASGEIDILETRGSAPQTAIGTIHYGGAYPHNTYKGEEYTFSTGDSTTRFHTYRLIWERSSISWSIDGREYARQSSWFSSGGGYPAPFDRDFYLILNVAVGGHFDGSPNGNTPFPAEMQVDYVRFYRAKE